MMNPLSLECINEKASCQVEVTEEESEEGIVNFATIILRNDNSELLEIIAEFTESIQLLGQKPE